MKPFLTAQKFFKFLQAQSKMISAFFIIFSLSCSPKRSSVIYLKDATQLPIGAAFNVYHAFHYRDENFRKSYQSLYSNNLDFITDEWAMKMEEIWTASNTYNFSNANLTKRFAQKNNLKIRGHTLVWESHVPDWIKNGDYNIYQIEFLIESYIKAVVGHFLTDDPDLVPIWDVINEPLNEEGQMRGGFFQNILGTEYIYKSLQWANQAAPHSKLFINEYGIEQNGPKQEALFLLVQFLLQNNAPLHGIGFQTHLSIDDNFNVEEFGNALDRFIDLGLEVQITELDVRINDDHKGISSEKLKKQAQLFRDVSKQCLQRYPKCSAFFMWGLTDEDSYVNRANWLTQSIDWPHPFDQNLNGKLAFHYLLELFLDHKH